jgi:hypothetical protein
MKASDFIEPPQGDVIENIPHHCAPGNPPGSATPTAAMD